MINHARTLLLNQARDQTHYSDLGYEYISPNFRPVNLPPALKLIRGILFGNKPDNYFRNFRCRELLSYIHSSEFDEYIYRLDSRVTYWPEIGNSYFEAAGRRIFITQTRGQPRSLNISGNLNAVLANGAATGQYTVELKKTWNDETAPWRFSVRPAGATTAAAQVEITNTLSPPVLKIPGTDLKIRAATNLTAATTAPTTSTNNKVIIVENYQPTVAAEPTDSNVVATWLIETKASPPLFITSGITALEKIGEPVAIDLFGVVDVEPYNTFKNLWEDHPITAYRLAGFILALIYRTNELIGKQ